MQPKTIDDKYRLYISTHRWILEDFTKRAVALARAGATRLSAKHLVETMRAEHKLRPSTGEKFGLNNTFATSLAHDAIVLAPELDGLFVFKDERDNNIAVITRGRCPNCGARSQGVCSPECEADLERDHERNRAFETIESRCGLEFFEGLDSLSDWR